MTTTILVVEDDSAIRDFLSECFQDEGYQVMTTATGTAAMQILVTQRVDVVLVDRSLPDMDGVSLWSRVRARAKTRQLPVILMSAGRINAEHTYGPDTMVLAKPFPLDELLRLVARLVRTTTTAPHTLQCAGLDALERRDEPLWRPLAEAICAAGMGAAMQVLTVHGWR